jgi:hypothetical protein
MLPICDRDLELMLHDCGVYVAPADDLTLRVWAHEFTKTELDDHASVHRARRNGEAHIMSVERSTETKPFPGSPTGNQSGVGGTPDHPKPETPATKGKPTEPYPGSPTGNASGTGEGHNADSDR